MVFLGQDYKIVTGKLFLLRLRFTLIFSTLKQFDLIFFSSSWWMKLNRNWRQSRGWFYTFRWKALRTAKQTQVDDNFDKGWDRLKVEIIEQRLFFKWVEDVTKGKFVYCRQELMILTLGEWMIGIRTLDQWLWLLMPWRFLTNFFSYKEIFCRRFDWTTIISPKQTL